MSGPCARPVSASRSGRNSVLPLRPVASFKTAVKACQGSLDQSICPATSAACVR